jgi:hypothetical protein
MATKDPYPAKTFVEAMHVLGERFPEGNIDHQPTVGDIFISLPLKDGGSFRAVLTWKQAKYLAFGRLTGDDLKSGKFPPDWPR